MTSDDIDAFSGEQQPMAGEPIEVIDPTGFNAWQGWGFFVVTLPGCFVVGLALYLFVR